MKIKINGQEIEVKEGDALDIGSSDADLAAAKEIGEKIATEALAKMGGAEVGEVSKRVKNFLDAHVPSDSKLAKILHGKDLFGGDELTANEKIVGFFHGLVTNNAPVLKALAEGVDADGGYLFPNEFLAELVRDLPEINRMRNWVRVIPMKRDKMDIATLVNGPDVFWTAENAAKSTTTARFSTAQLVAYKMAAIIYSSDELIEDSSDIDVVQMIIQLFAERIAAEEEKVIWQGNGTTQPQGISVATIASVAGTGNAYDDVTNLFYALPEKYRVNGAWFMNSQTAKSIELVKDTTGRPLFVPSSTDAFEGTLKGKPVVISEWVPNRQVYFGDLKKGYFFGDRKRMTVKVTQDSETAFTKDQTAIRVVERIAGKVVLAAAIRKATNF